MTLELKSHPDAFGFYYGTIRTKDGAVHHVNLLPPKKEWTGDFIMDGCVPDPTKWILYAEGVELGRVEQRNDAPLLLDAERSSALTQLRFLDKRRDDIAKAKNGSLARKLWVAGKLWLDHKRGRL